MTPTPPDRSVEEIVAEFYKTFPLGGDTWVLERHQNEVVEWLREKLTPLQTQGIEAGRRERDTQVQAVVRALDECIECCELVNGTDYCKNCGLEKEMYATLKHPNGT